MSSDLVNDTQSAAQTHAGDSGLFTFLYQLTLE